MAQTVKNLPAIWKTWVQFLGQEDPLGKRMTTHSRFLPWRIPWTEATVHRVAKSQAWLSDQHKLLYPFMFANSDKSNNSFNSIQTIKCLVCYLYEASNPNISFRSFKTHKRDKDGVKWGINVSWAPPLCLELYAFLCAASFIPHGILWHRNDYFIESFLNMDEPSRQLVTTLLTKLMKPHLMFFAESESCIEPRLAIHFSKRDTDV